MGLSVFSGLQFLALYLASLVACLVASVAIGRWLKPEGDAAGRADPDELAFLASSRQRYLDAVVARLLAARALTIEGGVVFRVLRPDGGATSAERAVLREPSPIKPMALRGALAQDITALDERLVRKGWIVGGGELWQQRAFALIPFALLLLLGWYRKEAGDALGEPTGLLSVLMFFTVIVAVFRAAAISRLTHAGSAVLADAREAGSRLKRAPTEPEMGTAVALYGTGVLAGTSLSTFHQMRQASSNDGGGGADGSSGCGGGGCGGGGCGGCGG